jgi:hypothetical protein
MQNFKEFKEATLVPTEPDVYVKTAKKVGRPKKTVDLTKINNSINQLFATAQADEEMQRST